MKSRVINIVRAVGQRSPRASAGFSRFSFRLPSKGVAFGAALCALSLSGCYYPYGYYPSASYYPAAYSTVPATAVQQDAPTGPADAQSQQQQQQQQQAQGSQQNPPTYAVAAPPVYVAPAPAYPAYYPPPVYPAYYGYPGYYGPSVSIGIGGYWGGGWGHRHWH